MVDGMSTKTRKIKTYERHREVDFFPLGREEARSRSALANSSSTGVQTTAGTLSRTGRRVRWPLLDPGERGKGKGERGKAKGSRK